jgi:hydroxyacylglutathione hydrolase
VFWRKSFAVGPLGCNCSVVANTETKEALIVDPGGDGEKILDLLTQEGFTLKWILHTHAHFDHFLASGFLHEKTAAPMALHADDTFLWNMLETQCGMFGIPCEGPLPPPSFTLDHEQVFHLGEIECCALHTPGHTPGSVSFSFANEKVLLSGDTLFRGGVGRTDLWGGDFKALEAAIQTRLYTLDEDTLVIPGHGPSTSIGDELRQNPFVSAR